MEQMSDLDQAWHSVLTDLQPHQRAWLHDSKPVTLHESTAIVAVPNEFTRSQLEGRLRAQLEDALTDRFGHEIRIAVTVDTSLEQHGDFSSETSPATDHPLDDSTEASATVPASSAPAPPLREVTEAPIERPDERPIERPIERPRLV